MRHMNQQGQVTINPKKKNSRDRLSLKGCSQSVLAGQMLENMQYYVVTYSVYTVHNIYEYRNVTSVGSPADSECNLIQNNFIYLWFVKQLQATKYQKSVDLRQVHNFLVCNSSLFNK